MATKEVAITTLLAALNKLNSVFDKLSGDDLDDIRYEHTYMDAMESPFCLEINPSSHSTNFVLCDSNGEWVVETKDSNGLLVHIKALTKILEKVAKDAPFRVGGYEVKYDGEGISVGCREVSYEEFDRLVEYVAKHRQDK